MGRPQEVDRFDAELPKVRCWENLRDFLQKETDEKAQLIEGYSLASHIRGILTKYMREKVINNE